ncbi:putative Ubiquitin-like protease family profile domain-containing protein [Seiridium cardinale]|uniref:Ubiquitin-like protease family profile domain-containing protein n=1 Tax=Seiridium cardinale TaxID=138064 RepID=A0ABR2XRK8_9PEZI
MDTELSTPDDPRLHSYENLSDIHGNTSDMEAFDNNWDLEEFDPKSLTSKVLKIHLCALINQYNEGEEEEEPTNHWTLCLQTSAESSVMMDMAPGYGEDGLRGKIHVFTLDRCYDQETLRAFSFTPTQEIDVNGFMQLLVSKGRNLFTFSPEFEGCRFWQAVIMKDLEAAHWIESGSAAKARDALLLYYRNPSGTEPRVMREGVFR